MYNASGTLNKDQLVTQFAPLVKRIAYHLMAKLPASVEVEDLMHSITLQRLDAARDASEGPAYDRYTLDMLKIAVPYTHN